MFAAVDIDTETTSRMAFGYVYPAYECYKTVEKNKPEIEQLRFWCQYWILVAILTVCERIGDAFVSWIPMYSEAKLAFIIYLWYPKTKGATYVYDAFFRPYVAKHENDIDHNLSELKTRAGDITALTWQRAMSYGQTRVFEILQYIASQSTPPPRPAQPQQQIRRAHPSTPALDHQESVRSQPPNEEPPSPTSSAASNHNQKDGTELIGPANAPQAAPAVPSLSTSKAGTSSENPYRSVPTEAQAMESEDVAAMDYEIVDSPPAEIMLEENEALSSLRSRPKRDSAPKQ
ncbi:hypothetical protein CDL15_Pgr021340 [Punica granatum]|uniref:HVA22-like protein n=1 Tax=Punica granatum TaxID=22663 RepID=A0A218WR58_PUNGR|nr:hypothetical protein CDL15_Pgr021340 [Punica granatum]